MTTPDSPQPAGTPDSPVTPDTTRDASLADEVFDEPTRALPATGGTTASASSDDRTTWAPAPPSGGTATATAVRPEVAAVPAVPPREYVKGPAPFAIVLGLLGLVVAAATLFSEVVGFDVPWGDLGPWTVVGAGGLVLLVGALGLRSSRSQD